MTAETLSRLIEAHTAFVLDRLTGDALSREIDLEVEAAFERLSTLSLAELVPEATVTAFLVAQMQTAPLTPASREVVLTVVRAIRAADQNARLHAGDFVAKKDFDTVVDRFAGMQELRGKLIRSVLGSPLYAGLISDVLFNGIRDYVLSDNNVAMKIPGMGSLMKVGKWGLDKTMPNLEQTLEKTLKGYIEANISRTMGISEKFLDNSLNKANIRKLSDHVWKIANEPSVKDVLAVVREDDLGEALEFVDESWAVLRTNPHLAEWVRLSVEGVYAAHGSRPLAPWLASLGFDRAHVVAQLKAWLPEVLEREVVREYLRERVRAQLRAFYESDAARAALAG